MKDTIKLLQENENQLSEWRQTIEDVRTKYNRESKKVKADLTKLTGALKKLKAERPLEAEKLNVKFNDEAEKCLKLLRTTDLTNSLSIIREEVNARGEFIDAVDNGLERGRTSVEKSHIGNEGEIKTEERYKGGEDEPSSQLFRFFGRLLLKRKIKDNIKKPSTTKSPKESLKTRTQDETQDEIKKQQQDILFNLGRETNREYLKLYTVQTNLQRMINIAKFFMNTAMFIGYLIVSLINQLPEKLPFESVPVQTGTNSTA